MLVAAVLSLLVGVPGSHAGDLGLRSAWSGCEQDPGGCRGRQPKWTGCPGLQQTSVFVISFTTSPTEASECYTWSQDSWQGHGSHCCFHLLFVNPGGSSPGRYPQAVGLIPLIPLTKADMIKPGQNYQQINTISKLIINSKQLHRNAMLYTI